MRNSHRGPWLFAGGACLVVGGLAAGLVFAFSGGTAPAAAAGARSYPDFQACLLTGERGLADPAAAPLWAGMRQASDAAHARVSYLAVRGPQTKANAIPFLGSLLVRHCGVVLAAGQAQRDAVAARAPAYPSVRFAVVGGSPAAANVTVLSGDAAAVQAGAAGEVTRAAGSKPPAGSTKAGGLP